MTLAGTQNRFGSNAAAVAAARIRAVAVAASIFVVALGALPASAKPDVKTWQEISALEDRRSQGQGRLEALLQDKNPDTRALAARAMGRNGFEESVPALLKALEDASPEVRRNAVFALGLIGAPAAREGVAKIAKSGATIEERREAVLALGRLGASDPKAASAAILPFLADPLPVIRDDAAIALARTADSSAAPQLRPLLNDADPAVQESAVWAAGRLGAVALAPEIRALLGSANAEVRLAASRAIGQVGDSTAIAPLAALAKDPDWKVRANVAYSLGRAKSTSALPGLAVLGKDSSPHVRAATAFALADVPYHFKRDDILYPLRSDASPEVRGATMPAFGVGQEKRKSVETDYWVAAGDTASAYVVRMAYDSFADAALRCEPGSPLTWRGAATFYMKGRFANPEAPISEKIDAGMRLGDFSTAWPRKELLEALSLVHPQVTAASLHALGKMDPQDTTALRMHQEETAGIIGRVLDEDPAAGTEPDIRIMGAEALGSFDRPEVNARLKKMAAEDPDYRVRLEAASSLEKLGEPRPDVQPSHDLSGLAAPLADDFLKSRDGRYTAVLTTSRGEIEIELLNQEAPRTVQNFVQLAEKGYYDGLSFHRVVPNFVIQTGCPIGNGWGGPGYEMRCEISPLHYERGMVGMAHAGKDTGGSQFFVTHSSQPHLDGRYTIFGRVIRGMDVVDSIEIEDVLKKVKIKKKLL